jgi:SEC-C motif domain protein
MKNCYCCSEKYFEDCCEPFIKGLSKPLTAQILMRSRYTAYTIVNVEYLLKTTHPKTRQFHNVAVVKHWATSNSWQKLEIISTENGSATDKIGVVEFKAYYLDEHLQPQIHHEISNFVKELGKWFFVDGKISNDLK